MYVCDSKVKVVSSLCLSKNSDRLYLGTDNGDVYTLDILSFKLTNGVLKHETVVQAYVCVHCYYATDGDRREGAISVASICLSVRPSHT